MCGIYGYIGKGAKEKVFKGLERLEYRGYDSAGIAIIDKAFKKTEAGQENIQNFDGLVTIKAKGELSALEGVLSEVKTQTQIAIGHTRWATHGKPSVENSHPHVSGDGNWAVVHNGIIENYKELKQTLPQVNFASDTDTEVVAHLLEKMYDGNILSTIKKVCELLEGSFAFAIVTKYAPDKIFVARRGSPVAVGAGKNVGVVCSDLNSIENAESFFLLDNDNYAVVEKGAVHIYDKDLQPLQLKDLAGLHKQQRQPLGRFKHYMKKEICEAPRAIEKTVEKYCSFEKLRAVLPEVAAKKVENVLIIGCGTAYHAGLIGKVQFEKLGVKCEVVIASEFRYGDYVALPNTLAIFISQSGETADTIEAAKRCKSMGMTTLAITNVENSSITFEVDHCVYTQAGAEIGVASTKAYDCQVAALYLLVSYFSAVRKSNKKRVNEVAIKLVDCARIMEKSSIEVLCRRIAQKIAASKNIFMIGRGQDYYIALEASLKLKEISYIHSEAYPAGELKHGTISLIEQGTKVFAFATEGRIKDKTYSNVNEVLSRGGEVILLTQFPVAKSKGVKVVRLPQFEQEYLPLIAAGYMQRVAYYTSLFLGHNPDKPRSLAKSVTVE